MELKVGMKFEGISCVDITKKIFYEILSIEDNGVRYKFTDSRGSEHTIYHANKDNFAIDLEYIGLRLIPENGPAGCNHDRKTYTGLFEIFDYCSKCNERL